MKFSTVSGSTNILVSFIDLISSQSINCSYKGNPSLCRQITTMSTVCDVKWASQNCSLSFHTIGVWPENADGTDVNTVCRNADSSLLATGDDFGRVKLFMNPAIQPKVSNGSLISIFVY